MKLTIAIVLALILTFGLHWAIAKMCRTSLKDFYKYYSQDEYTASYLVILSVAGFLAFLLLTKSFL